MIGGFDRKGDRVIGGFGRRDDRRDDRAVGGFHRRD